MKGTHIVWTGKARSATCKYIRNFEPIHLSDSGFSGSRELEIPKSKGIPTCIAAKVVAAFLFSLRCFSTWRPKKVAAIREKAEGVRISIYIYYDVYAQHTRDKY